MNNLKTRIPKIFSPIKYTISLYIDILSLNYTIEEEIKIISESDNSPYLILNAHLSYFKIISLSLQKFDIFSDDFVPVSETYLTSIPDKENLVEDCIYIPIPKEKPILKNDQLKLKFKISGKITSLCDNGIYFNFFDNEFRELSRNQNKFEEFWKSNNQNINNLKKTKILDTFTITIINAPIKFRKILPCFDEPVYKSIYSFNLILDQFYYDNFKTLKCVTNGSLINVILDKLKHKYIFYFNDTPKMSCYLFTFNLGNFDFIESINHENNIKIRVFTPLLSQHDGALAMTLAQNSLIFYQNYFDIPYCYDKLDLVPIPEMNYRAMENLGCIVFLNYSLLYTHFQSITEKKFISRTICHEISHMWFGDLVTMEWWNDIWLNEGFARILEFVCLSNIEKEEYEYRNNFIINIYENAITSDEKAITHPINAIVNSANEIDEIFDVISYSKGSSIIRMLMYYIGEDLFKKSLRKYLKENMFKNTTTKILWKNFDDVCGNMNINELMNEWINFKGHPLINVKIDDEKNFLLLEQKNMLNEETMWKVPLFLKTKNIEKVYLMESNLKINLKDIGINYDEIEQNKNFIIVNDSLKGFYRVEYSDELLNNIIEEYIKNPKGKVNEIDVYGILSYEKSKKSFDKLIEIIKKISPIKKHILLKLILSIYKSMKSKNYKEGMEFIELNNDEKDNNKINDINNKLDDIDLTFYNFIDNKDKTLINELCNKFWVGDENSIIYNNQFNDEFEELYLYFLCVIGNNEEIAKKILLVPDFKLYYHFVNKNLIYTINHIILKYIYLIKKDEQINFFIILLSEHIKNYYNNSIIIRIKSESSLFTLYNADISIFEYFFKEVIFTSDGRYNFNLNLITEKNKNRKKILDTLFKLIKENYEEFLKEKEENNKISLITYINESNLRNNNKVERYIYIWKYILKQIPDLDFVGKIIDYYFIYELKDFDDYDLFVGNFI